MDSIEHRLDRLAQRFAVVRKRPDRRSAAPLDVARQCDGDEQRVSRVGDPPRQRTGNRIGRPILETPRARSRSAISERDQCELARRLGLQSTGFEMQQGQIAGDFCVIGIRAERFQLKIERLRHVATRPIRVHRLVVEAPRFGGGDSLREI